MLVQHTDIHSCLTTPPCSKWPFKEVEFESVNISRASSGVSGPKFTRFCSPNVKGIVVDNAVLVAAINTVPGGWKMKEKKYRKRRENDNRKNETNKQRKSEIKIINNHVKAIRICFPAMEYLIFPKLSVKVLCKF